MEKCQICGHLNENKVRTCSRCGMLIRGKEETGRGKESQTGNRKGSPASEFEGEIFDVGHQKFSEDDIRYWKERIALKVREYQKKKKGPRSSPGEEQPVEKAPEKVEVEAEAPVEKPAEDAPDLVEPPAQGAAGVHGASPESEASDSHVLSPGPEIAEPATPKRDEAKVTTARLGKRSKRRGRPRTKELPDEKAKISRKQDALPLAEEAYRREWTADVSAEVIAEEALEPKVAAQSDKPVADTEAEVAAEMRSRPVADVAQAREGREPEGETSSAAAREEQESPAGDVAIHPGLEPREEKPSFAGRLEEPLRSRPEAEPAAVRRAARRALPEGRTLLPRRAVAFLIDLTVLAILFLTHTLVTSRFVGLPTSRMLADYYIQFLIFHLFLFFLYFVFFQALVGQTIGMQLMRLEIVSFREEGITFSSALLRTVVFLLMLLPAGTGLIFMFLNDEGFGFHDRASGTGIVPCSES
jgi:uncharacterized RDD family membrane protein YckC